MLYLLPSSWLITGRDLLETIEDLSVRRVKTFFYQEFLLCECVKKQTAKVIIIFERSIDSSYISGVSSCWLRCSKAEEEEEEIILFVQLIIPNSCRSADAARAVDSE